MSELIDELGSLLDEVGLTVRFGLRAQGHIPTIKRMLEDGETWRTIGETIGWCPDTARQHWGWHVEETVRT